MRAPSTFMLAAMALGISRAMAADPSPAGYVTDSSGTPVKSSAGQCWHTSQGTPGMAAGCERAATAAGAGLAPPAETTAAAATSERGAAYSSSGGNAPVVGMNSARGLTDSSGAPVRSSSGQCWGTGFSASDAACAAVAGTPTGTAATAALDQPARDGSTSEARAAGGGMVGADTSTASGLTDSSGAPVRSSSGQCWGTGFSASDAACAAVAGTATGAAATAALDQPARDGSTSEARAAGGGMVGADTSTASGLTDSSGAPVRNGFGQCWGTGFSGADPACAAVAGTGVAAGTAAATTGLTGSAGESSPRAALAGDKAAVPAGFAPIRSGGNPAYLTDSNGIVVRSSQGECWRTGSWSPALATVVGCDGVLTKAVPVPAPAPSPKPEPVPPSEPAAQMQPESQSQGVDTLPAPPVPPAPAPVPPAAAPGSEPTPPAAAAPDSGSAPAPAPAVPSPPSSAPAEIAPPQSGTAPQRADAAPSGSEAQEPRTEKVTLDTDTYFDFDKSTLKPEGKRKLDELASRIASMQLEVVVATGHTDATGSDAYNQKLSERRARAVKNYLVEKGLPAGRIFTDGKGEKQPVATNKTREGRASNRRVEVELVGTRR